MEKIITGKAVSPVSFVQESKPQYRLVIPADEPVSRQVKQLTKQWEKDFGHRASSEKPPSITLATFTAREEMEETLMRWIRRVCQQQQVFPVVLNNFSAIPPQILYIRVQDAGPFTRLAVLLRSMADFIQDGKFFDKPFIKLGDVPEGVAAETVMQYTHQIFHAAFMARQIILFRKVDDQWQVVSQFPFRLADA